MSIYRLVGMLESGRAVSRYIRADNAITARVRAYKAFKMRVRALAVISDQASLDYLGTIAYDVACNEAETYAHNGATLRAQQKHNGADNTGRQCWKPSNAAIVKTNNKAHALMVKLGLAPDDTLKTSDLHPGRTSVHSSPKLADGCRRTPPRYDRNDGEYPD